MKRLVIILVLIFTFLTLIAQKSYKNPAAVYCIAMGCKYEITTDSKGNSISRCILPDGSQVDPWDFYKGKVGKEYSYCAKKGYQIETEVEDHGSYKIECAVCISKDKAGKPQKIKMTDLMDQNGEPLILDEGKKSPQILSYL